MSLTEADVQRLRGAVAGPDTFDARFEVVRDAGAGGMGRVYEALDRETGRRVAIKLVDKVADHARFVAEAEVLERLEHEAIVSYVRHGATKAGEPYLVMDWLVGETLAKRLERGALTVAETIVVGARLAAALEHAHAAGVVHRDVKPSNVLLVDGDVARATLIDFGVAKTARDLTHTGQLIGTPGYMAPEQVRGEKGVDGRVDLFALGCVLYEAMSARAPFEGTEVMEILARLLLEEPRPIDELVPAVPPRLAALVDDLLAKDARDRIADATRVRAELAAIAAGDTDAPARAPRSVASETVRERPVAKPIEQPIEQSAPKRRRWWIAGVAAGALAVVGGILVFARGDRAEPPAAVLPCTKDRFDGCADRCAGGDAEACYHAGQASYLGRDGHGVDHVAAVASYARACVLGFDPACAAGAASLLRAVTDHERTAAEVYPQAQQLLEVGCTRGYAPTCRRLGAEHAPGTGKLAPDGDRAVAFTAMACDKDDLAACTSLRKFLDAGHGGDAMRARGETAWRDACRRLPRLGCK